MKKTNKCALLIVLALLAGLFLLPQSALAARNPSDTPEKNAYNNITPDHKELLKVSMPQVAMTNLDLIADANDLAAEINSWGIGLSATVSGSTVIVTGNVSEQNWQRSLLIPENVVLDWRANYSGKVDGEGDEESWFPTPLLYFYGDGTVNFNNGTISNSGYNATTLFVGTPACSVNGTAIIEAAGALSGAIFAGSFWDDEENGIAVDVYITINSGIVRSTDGNAIFAGRNVTVTGGLVQASGTAISAGYSQITVSGGLVESTGKWGCAIGSSGIRNDENTLIKSAGNVYITGGTVRATGDDGCAIGCWGVLYDDDGLPLGGHVTVSGGEVITSGDSDEGWSEAISTPGNVSVSGGLVEASGEDSCAIKCWGYWDDDDNPSSAPKVTVSGGVVRNTGKWSLAINAIGDVEIKGNAKVINSGYDSSSIWNFGNVAISGGLVQATGKWGWAVNTYGNVIVSGNAKIEATGNDCCAIYSRGNIMIESGEIKTTGSTVDTWTGTVDANGNITVKGGTVISTGTGAYSAACAGTITVDGGQILATGANSSAIDTSGHGVINGGEVKATGNAYDEPNGDVYTIFASRNVTVSGGLVISTGNSMGIIQDDGDIEYLRVITISSKGDVLVNGGVVAGIGGNSMAIDAKGNLTVSNGVVLGVYKEISQFVSAANDFTGPIGDGIIIAYDIGENDPYITGSSTDLRFWPISASVSWAKNDSINGISYANGVNNKGFIAIPGIIVNNPYTPGTSSSGGGTTTFTVTFDSNDGSEVPKQTVGSGAKATKPADPAKEGYIFGGWFTDKELTKAYNFDTSVSGSFTLYAKWGETKTVVETKTWQNPFTDVKTANWFYADVEFVAQNGLFNGISATTFGPQGTMTRAMLFTVLARLAGVETEGGDTWYSLALDWAVKEGLTDGSNPQNPVTREQIVAILWRYAGKPAKTGSLTDFPDSPAVSEWAVDAFKWAVELGIINGKDGKLVPQGHASRAEVAAILHRFVALGK